MKLLVIVLIIALLLGPLAWMLPSPAERQREHLRQRARELGLHIKVCALPQSRRERIRRERPRQGVAYSLRSGEEEHRAALYWQRNQDGSWQGGEGGALPTEQLAWLERLRVALPPGVVALQRQAGSATIYWTEQGSIAGVDAIASVLQELLALP